MPAIPLRQYLIDIAFPVKPATHQAILFAHRHRLMRTHLAIFYADHGDVALQPCSRAPSRGVLKSHVIKSPNLIG